MNNMQKLKLISPVVTILIVLLVSTLLLAAAGTGSTFAFVVEGKDCGLNVRAADGFTDVGNLNPGDTKSSYLTVTNEGEVTFPYFFSIKKIRSKPGSYRGETGEPLDKILEMTVKLGEETLFSGKIADLNKELAMGNLAVGEEQQVDISVYFPGEAGNEYQGSEVTVQFKFRAVCGSGGGEDPPPGDEDPPPGDEDPPPGGDDYDEPPADPEAGPPGQGEIIEPGEPEVSPPGELIITPAEPTEPPGELEVGPELPKTGEFSRPAIYGLGLLIILAGLLLRKRALSRKRG